MTTIDFLKQASLFKGLAERELEILAADFVPREFQAGQAIFHQGDPGHMLYLVESGQVRIFVNGLDGHETSVVLYGRPGEIFGELAIIDGLPRSASAVAVMDTIVHTLSRGCFRAYMQRWPQLALNFMQTLTKKVRYNTHQMDSLASMAVSQRLARKLLELGQNYGSAETLGVRLNTALTQSDLASMIGATRESTNKVLRQFRDDGMIALNNGQTIIIRDVEALRTMVSG
ncbi:MAG: Crp/Fnr family transcriptional regulator [Phycisphaerae bacterium]|nr:Crp/Fnr family transcriptional regulator [Phycisphaerae bacterium]NIP52369.1 Crp/Fnr family transcriptional regulator [Phycisphaerae bacterium]NIX28395.1 cyclic nucleotide-binding domain-containing protein [Phycisphaerae bacterium]